VKKLKFPRLTPVQIASHVTAWFLVAWLAIDAVTGNLTVNPIQIAEQRTGRYALYFLVLSLACTPFNTLFGFRQALTARRTLGLYTFMFACMHLSILVGVDYGFNIGLLVADVGTKRYILVGLLAMLILIPLAITSFRWWMKRMGKAWKRLHQLVYLAGVAAVLHYAWAKKGDLFSLQGDITMPLVIGLLVLLLLGLRLPPVRKRVVDIRQFVKRQFEKRISSRSTVKAPS
jgi:sulfoxide reductase heme-binding subunit YedZ